MDDKKDAATREAFAIYFAGGKDKIRDGLQIDDAMRTRARRAVPCAAQVGYARARRPRGTRACTGFIEA